MHRREFLTAAVAAQTRPAGRRPNIVFILSDDHRWDMMGCAGHPWLKTPNLDRLAAGGARFRNAFVTTSLCSPSRACILTGQYMHTHGVVDNFHALRKDAVTFPKLMQKAGYRNAFIGKWHMGDSALTGAGREDNSDMPQPGFDHWISFRGQGSYRNPLLNFNGTRKKVEGYITDILTEEALRFLAQPGDQPFCLYLSHKAVHAGFDPADRHKALYSDAPVPKPPFEDRGEPEWRRKKRTTSLHGMDHLYGGRQTIEKLYRDYCRTLAAVDESTGAVLDALAKRGALENTLVVYMGDNGFMLGEHGLVDKRVMYEQSIRVPLLAHWPAAIRPAQTIDGMALNIDICPTFLEAAGVAKPAGIHGRSLLPLLRGQTVGWRSEFLYEYFWDYEALHTPGVTGIRTEHHALMEYQGIWDINELYDLDRDPQQKNNLLAGSETTTQSGGWLQRVPSPETRRIAADLHSRLLKLLDATGGRESFNGPPG